MHDCDADELAARRKPCTRGESGFLRTPRWVPRCFIAFLFEPPGPVFNLTYRLRESIMFAHISSRCMTCGKTQRKGGIPDAEETRKVREAPTATNPLSSNHRRAPQATAPRQGPPV